MSASHLIPVVSSKKKRNFRFGKHVNVSLTSGLEAQCGRTSSPQSGQRVIGVASITHKYVVLRAIETDFIPHAPELDTA